MDGLEHKCIKLQHHNYRYICVGGLHLGLCICVCVCVCVCVCAPGVCCVPFNWTLKNY